VPRLYPPLPAPISVLLVLAGCLHVPPIPGPLGPLGRAPVAPLSLSKPPTLDHPAEPVAPEAVEPNPFGESIADAAEHYLDVTPPSWRGDCSSFVCAAATRAGWPLTGNTRSLWEMAEALDAVHKRKIPAIGDLAFFDQTYDRNENGKLDDDLTHVAVVIDVDDDGTVLLAHAGTSQGRTTLRMNLLHPDVRVNDAGEELNGLLRRERESDRAGTPHLAAECWRGFATLDPDLVLD